ncbi:MAG: hypothetical protein U1E08_05035 [Coriobacteriia bacterium]|nr:hypothetical protein [Coriobacteriia bacterium]
MSDESSAAPARRRGVPIWLLIVALVAVAAAAGGVAWYLASQPGDDPVMTGEATTVAEPDEADEVAEPADTPVVADEAPGPSYVRYAYVRAVTGTSGGYEASLDLFDIFTGAEAEAYASAHGMTVPANGILYVNEDEMPESVPLSDDVVITYNTGGVEDLITQFATSEQLRDWAAGSETAMPGAFRDQWRVTVVEGVATRLEMIAVAD